MTSGTGYRGRLADDELDDQLVVHQALGWQTRGLAVAAAADGGKLERRVVIACQGGGSYTAFTAGVLRRLLGTVGQANYGAAKAGIVSLTTITALEMARYGVTANAISPIALTRMTDGIAGVAVRNPVPGDPALDGFDPQDPANASGLVVYLASDAASWLTGQVFRVHGNRVQRLRGWRSAGEYRSRSGRAVEPGELVAGLPEVYGTAPAGRLPDPAVHGA